MADEIAAKLFQDEGAVNFDDKPLRLAISTRLFFQTLEPLVSRQRRELAKRQGLLALEQLKETLLYELANVQEAIDNPPEGLTPTKPHEDVASMVITLIRQAKGQAGFAYYSHKSTCEIREEKEVRAAFAKTTQERASEEKALQEAVSTAPVVYDEPFQGECEDSIF